MTISLCPPRHRPGQPASFLTAWIPARVPDRAAARAHRKAVLRPMAGSTPGERPLAATCDAADATVVVTDTALHRFAAPDGAGAWSRWGREQVSRIGWHASESRLELVRQPPHLPDGVHLTIPAPGSLVALARDRVRWTTQLVTRASLRCGHVRVVVRRQPMTNRMDWFLYPEPDVEVGRPDVQAQLHELVTHLRSMTGL